jgi:hypothetical protein
MAGCTNEAWVLAIEFSSKANTWWSLLMATVAFSPEVSMYKNVANLF